METLLWDTSIYDQGTQNLEQKYGHMMFVFVTSVGGTPLLKGHLPRVPRVSLEKRLYYVRFWQNVSRGCPLNVEVLLYALFTGRINLFPRQTIEEPRWTGVTVPTSQKCFHGIIKSSSKHTDVVRRSKPCEVVAFDAKNRAFVWYRAGQ